LRIIIIGGGPAGVSSAIAARQTNPTAEAHVFTEDKYIGYSRSFLPFLFSDMAIDNAMLYNLDFLKELNINVHLQTKVSSIDIQENKILFNQGSMNYDRLIICSGTGRRSRPNVRGIDLPHAIPLWDYQDGLTVQHLLKRSKNIFILGSGFVGIEVAFLAAKRFGVTIVDTLESIKSLAFLDETFQRLFLRELENHKIQLRLGVKLTDMEISSNHVKVGSEAFPADLVIINMGDAPKDHLKFATDVGIATGAFRRLKIDEKCQTNVSNIYAAGDCTEFKDFADNPCFSTGEFTAKLQGSIAGANAAGGDERLLPMIIPGILAFEDFQLGWVGFTSQNRIIEAGLDPIVTDSEGYTIERNFPDSRSLKLRIYADKKSRRVVGAEIFGKNGVEERVNLLGLAIKLGAKISDLKNYEVAYMPNVASMTEPLVSCAFNQRL